MCNKDIPNQLTICLNTSEENVVNDELKQYIAILNDNLENIQCDDIDTWDSEIQGDINENQIVHQKKRKQKAMEDTRIEIISKVSLKDRMQLLSNKSTSPKNSTKNKRKKKQSKSSR